MGTKIVDCRWVFRLKKTVDCGQETYKTVDLWLNDINIDFPCFCLWIVDLSQNYFDLLTNFVDVDCLPNFDVKCRQNTEQG